jgi:REP element-mobilizing transposase RayT
VSHPLVIAYHLVWTAYGSWLPNDPRGSGSRTVESELLAGLGEVHVGRKKVQPPRREVREFYERAVELLKHPVLLFEEQERLLIAEAFGEVIAAERYTCYACAVMPDHVHIVIRKHKDTAEEMAEKLMQASKARLIEAKRREPDHPIWVGGTPWSDFLDHPTEVRRVIGYVERNPTKIGLPAQKWSFAKPYDNWPLHAGHSPNSPYAKRLRELGRYPH